VTFGGKPAVSWVGVVGALLGVTGIVFTVRDDRATSGDLDRAQEAFEHSAKWPQPVDFDTWRATDALKCRDIPTLRICEAVFPFFSDGKPVGKDRVAFACSPSVCAWVDP
jgi:hypothetical protein